MFPKTRLRRLRKNEKIINLTSETILDIRNIIYPLFICEGSGIKKEISSMRGQFTYSIDILEKELVNFLENKVENFLLFGIPNEKDFYGTSAYKDGNVIAQAIRRLRKLYGDSIVLCADVCLCEYTSHGHCGIPIEKENGKFIIDNDKTLEILGKISLSYAQAGADIIAPSDMMDGRVGYIRETLDKEGFSDRIIMSYSAKYASNFYGPFREAVSSSPQFGDRSSYQMHLRNRREAMREIELDINEGADIIMIKPALAYLDVISEARRLFNVPLAAYSVSGEYSLVQNSIGYGYFNEQKIVMEILYSIKRAGADIIITYWAPRIAKWLEYSK